MRRYRADAPGMRLCVAAEGLTLLFHRPSGTTHVLLPPAPELLDMLAEAPADAEALALRLAADYALEADDGADEPIAAVVAARLDELEAAGLVLRA